MTSRSLSVLAVSAICVVQAWGQANQREPHIGYVYPAGGKQGTTFRVTVGGQFLRGASGVYVTGEGVHASVLEHYPPLRNIEKEQREALARRLRTLFGQRWSELAKDGMVSADPPWRRLVEIGLRGRGGAGGADELDDESAALPEHPLLYKLEDKSIRELLHVVHEFRNRGKSQQNTQIAETVLLEIELARDAAPGDREIRLCTRAGLTNPLVFQVGTLRETCELEPDEGPALDFLPEEPPLELPILVNGQITPGDADRIRFRAKQGQQLVIETQARHLIPYLADAVPGWFQATLTLRDDAGVEIAFADDYRFSPDPVLLYEVPKDGEYELEIHDSIYRGREDFVYRISVGQRQFITSIFPLGCRTGQKRYVSVDGWNLTNNRLFLDGQTDDSPGVRQKPLGSGKVASNPVTYEVNALRACQEGEDNNDIPTAQRVRLPGVVDGRISRPGDVDYFAVRGESGDEIVAEVIARRLRSPLDSLLRLMDSEGNVLAWNDDYEHTEGYLHTDMGVITHHADSFLRATLPTDGAYYVQVTDAQSHGGEEYAYRLRIGAPQPDFDVRVTPSSISVRGGFAAPLRIYALREDGFDGEIKLVLKDAPRGFVLSGARIPAGRDQIRATLSGPPSFKGPTPIKLEGHAKIGDETVTRPVVPAEDMMQAFLYRHLTPAQELVVAAAAGRRFGRAPKLAEKGPVLIPVGGVARVAIDSPARPRLGELELALSEPPPGVVLESVTPISGGIELEFSAESGVAQVGLVDNLIVEVFANIEREGRDGASAQQQRVSLGVLPAIPFEIVSQ